MHSMMVVMMVGGCLRCSWIRREAECVEGAGYGGSLFFSKIVMMVVMATPTLVAEDEKSDE